MADFQLNVKDSNGNSLSNTDVSFNLNNFGTITRTTDNDGVVKISGLYKGTYHYTIGDITGEFTIDDDTKTYMKDVIAKSANTIVETGNTVVNDIKTTTDNTIKGLVSAYVFKDTDNYDEIKEQYKVLNDNIKQQKNVLVDALKNNAYDLISAQGQNFTASITQGIQPLMDKLVAKRSDINPFSSFKNFGIWAKYTSMIAGVYALRQAIITFMEELTEKAKNKISSTVNSTIVS